MNSKAVVKLFAIFQARYGHKWVSAYSDPEVARLAVSEWTKGLAGFPEDWIRRGLDDWIDAWPPSLPEFQSACLPEPGEAGLDVHRMTMKRTGYDGWNWGQLPAEKAERIYDKAEKEVLLEYRKTMIQNPAHRFPALAAPVDNSRMLLG